MWLFRAKNGSIFAYVIINLFLTLNSHIINRFSIFLCRWVPNQRSFIFWHFVGLLTTFGCIYWPKTMKFTFFPWLRRLFKALDGSRVNQIPIFWALWIRNWKISLSLKFQFNRPILRRFRAVPSQKSKNDVLPWYKTETYLRIRKRAKSGIFFTFSGSIYKARKHGGGPAMPFVCMMPPNGDVKVGVFPDFQKTKGNFSITQGQFSS